MKKIYDKLFDAALAAFILITIVSSSVMIITSVVFTIQTGEHHTGIAVSAGIITLMALIVSYFFLYMQTGGNHDQE